jgi:hypothetical protein
MNTVHVDNNVMAVYENKCNALFQNNLKLITTPHNIGIKTLTPIPLPTNVYEIHAPTAAHQFLRAFPDDNIS